MIERQYDLEERLIDFSVSIIALVDSLPVTKASTHLGGQLLRSGTAPALNYGEVPGAESRKDFIHKMKIALKELRESRINMRIIQRAELLPPSGHDVLSECTELVRIFKKSVETAERNAPRANLSTTS